jgi:membrane-associated phospholipid phosphatase
MNRHTRWPDKHVFLFSLVAVLVSTRPAVAQEDSLRSTQGSLLAADLRTGIRDAGVLLASPQHFSQSQWLAATAAVGGTAALFIVDDPIRSFAGRNHSKAGDLLFGIGRQYGDATYAISFSGMLYLGGLIFKDEDVRETGLTLCESLAFAGLVTSVVKSVVGRSRPYAEEGAFKYRGFQFKAATTALPSGHSTVAFALSSVLASRLRKSSWSTVLYSLATLTALSRVYHGDHWMSDSFLGSAIGLSVGLAVTNLHDEQKPQTELRVVPTLGGLRAELRF